MSRSSASGAVREVLAAARAYAGPLAAIALVTLVVCAGLVGGHRELHTRTNSAFQTYLQQHSSTSGVTVTSTMTAGSAADLHEASSDVSKLLPAPATAYQGTGWTLDIPEAVSNLPTWLPSEQPETSKAQHQLPSALELVNDSQLASGTALRYTAGSAPSCGGTCTGADAAHPLPIAISEATAASLRVKVGTGFTLAAPNGSVEHVTISGLFQAAGSAPAGAAGELSSLLQPGQHVSVDRFAAIGPVFWLQLDGRALVAPDSFAVATGWSAAEVTWTYRVIPTGLTADDGAAFGDRMRAVVSAANPLPVAGDSQAATGGGAGTVFTPAAVTTGLPATIAAFESDAAAARALGLFVLVAAAMVGIATIQLALRVLFARQESDLALRRARGLGAGAAARRAAIQAAACAVPAAALGIAAALVLVPGADPGFVLGVGLAVVLALPLGAAVTALVPTHRAGPVSRRRRALLRTGTFLVLLLFAAVAAGVRTQLADASNPDLVSASLPTLAATVGALAVGSLVALLARPAAWLAAGRTRAAALFLAAAHAARRPALPAGAAVALLVATSSAVFASCFTASLDSARQLTAWQQTGADLHMHAQGEGAAIVPQDEANVAKAPGVRAGATGAVLGDEQLTTKQGTVNVTVVVIDPAEYLRLVAGTRLDSAGLDSALHALSAEPANAGTVSSVISSDLSSLVAGGDLVSVEKIGTSIAPVAWLDSFPAISGLSTFVVLPRSQVESIVRLTPPITDAWFDLAAGRNAAVTRAQAVQGVTVTVRAQRAAGLDSGPVGSIARWISRAAVVFDLVLAVVCLLLAGTLTAPARAAGRTFLATLGARRATGVAASVLESLPAFAMISVIATAAAFGALALLTPLIGRMAVGDPHALSPTALVAPAPAFLAVLGVPAVGLLLAAGRAAAEHRTRLSFLRDERDS